MNVNLENLFISGHAVRQFQLRIKRLSFEEAQQIIAVGILQAEDILTLPDGKTWRVRGRAPYPFEFRVFIVFDERFDEFAVKTLVRGDSTKTRRLRRKLAKQI